MSNKDDLRYAEASLRVLREPYVGHGKLEVLPKVVARDLDDIALLHTPGVGYPVKEILAREEALGELTGCDNNIAVVSDGTAVLGLGRAGPRAALPVVEGKASMFKLLVGIDAILLCLDVKSPEQLVDILVAAEPNFGGYNLEDVAAPHCFEVTEIMPEDSLAGGAVVVGSGRFDYPNQWNNVLAFPELMRGALGCGAMRIDHDAYLAASRAIAADVPESALRPDNILPTPLSDTLYPAVSEAVAQNLVGRTLARRLLAPGAVAEHTRKLRALVAERQAFVAARTPKY